MFTQTTWANPTNPMAYRTVPTTTQPMKASGIGAGIAIAVLTFCACALVALVAGGVLGVVHTAPSALAGIAGPRIVLDDRRLVNDETWTPFAFSLEQASTVDMTIDADSGDGVSAHLIAERDYEQFKRAKQSLFGGSFLHYPEFQISNVRHDVRHGELPAGRYVLVVSESSDVNIIGSPDTALARVHVLATPSSFARGGY